MTLNIFLLASATGLFYVNGFTSWYLNYIVGRVTSYRLRRELMVMDYDSRSDFGNSTHSVVELIILIVPNSADIEKMQIKSSLFSGPRV